MCVFKKTSGCPWPKATLKPLCENPGPKVEIPSLENHVLKTISKNFPGPKVEISSPKNHVLKTIF